METGSSRTWQIWVLLLVTFPGSHSQDDDPTSISPPSHQDINIARDSIMNDNDDNLSFPHHTSTNIIYPPKNPKYSPDFLKNFYSYKYPPAIRDPLVRPTVGEDDNKGFTEDVSVRFPWTVLITLDHHQCVATIIASSWLVTTAECALAAVTSGRVVESDIDVLTNDGRHYKALRGIPHPQFGPGDHHYADVGLIEMKEPIMMKEKVVAPICTLKPGGKDLYYTKPYVTTSPKKVGTRPTQRTVKGQFLRSPLCNERFHDEGRRLRNDQACSILDNKYLQCGRDDGAPWMLKMKGKWTLVGVSMMSEKYCAGVTSQDSRVDFVNLSHYRAWIDSNVEVSGKSTIC
ncbi:hypothetical protein Pcinc_015266 [Petrolisthes cinctipes]|uniref:Peptidase S1 domain-containing protein n=1 Tax=Petrolisthes cinctipes TaxID=88211 RepID=A0AAE1FUV4_PETCI|nr:hypothetical protein Pcinc_015266 [Petrolisthes cinctipes]